MGNSIKKSAKNAECEEIRAENYNSQISLNSFNLKRFDWSFRGSQSFSKRAQSFSTKPSRSLLSRRNQSNPTLADSSKISWPVAQTESIFLPQFKILSNNTEKKYTIQSKLARGAFGKVYLVRERETEKNYALKVISKAQVITNGTVLQLKDEVDIQSICGHHPFIVQCVTFWQNKKNIFLLSEYQCGELFNKVKYFSYSLVQLYVAEISIALDFLHNAGVIYRDLKPENLLINWDYHIKLTDFGLSKWLKFGQRTRTICGTLQYMAPEIINGEPYEHSVDYYALGIVTYRMLTDKYPTIIDHSIITSTTTTDQIDKTLNQTTEKLNISTTAVVVDDVNKQEHEKNDVVDDSSNKEVVNFNSNEKFQVKKTQIFANDDVEFTRLDSNSKDLLLRLLEKNPKLRLKSVLALERIAMYKGFKFDDVKNKKISPKVIIDAIMKEQQEQEQRHQLTKVAEESAITSDKFNLNEWPGF